MTRQSIFAAAALVAALTPAAWAGDLYTASMQAVPGTMLRCTITNVSTTEVGVTATLKDDTNATINTSGNCYGNPAVLNPGESCAVDSNIPDWKTGRCHFTASSTKVRAALVVIGNTGVVTSALPATK